MNAPGLLYVEVVSSLALATPPGESLPVLAAEPLSRALRAAWAELAPTFERLGAAADALGLGAGSASTAGDAVLAGGDAVVAGGDAVVAGGDAVLAIGPATLGEAVAEWLAHLASREAAPLRLERLVGALTTSDVRVAAAGSGEPVVTPALAAGVVLTAPLLWRREPSDAELAVLALAALGVRELGRGRRRGRGRVRCHLGTWEDTVALARGGIGS